MYIKILVGTYGHRPNPDDNYIEKKDCNSEPFEVSDKEAERLIGLGVAQRAVQFENEKYEDDAEMLESGEGNDELDQLSIKELRQMAKDLGLPADGSKAALAEKIRTIRNGSDEMEKEDEESPIIDDEGNQEDPPVLEAAEPEA